MTEEEWRRFGYGEEGEVKEEKDKWETPLMIITLVFCVVFWAMLFYFTYIWM